MRLNSHLPFNILPFVIELQFERKSYWDDADLLGSENKTSESSFDNDFAWCVIIASFLSRNAIEMISFALMIELETFIDAEKYCQWEEIDEFTVVWLHLMKCQK